MAVGRGGWLKVASKVIQLFPFSSGPKKETSERRVFQYQLSDRLKYQLSHPSSTVRPSVHSGSSGYNVRTGSTRVHFSKIVKAGVMARQKVAFSSSAVNQRHRGHKARTGNALIGARIPPSAAQTVKNWAIRGKTDRGWPEPKWSGWTGERVGRTTPILVRTSSANDYRIRGFLKFHYLFETSCQSNFQYFWFKLQRNTLTRSFYKSLKCLYIIIQTIQDVRVLVQNWQ